ncbi:MAG: hypothetical protein AMJ53_11990 [Gammaproteobacteria bacterium SG8_11]|nr:MAG: hypothetical protein AMJ53_11990 [Gammaproteobacteria bacterium SG8_11]
MCEFLGSGVSYILVILFIALFLSIIVLQTIIVDLIKGKHKEKYLEILGASKDLYEKGVEGMAELEIFLSFNKVYKENKKLFSDMNTLFSMYWGAIYLFTALGVFGLFSIFRCMS